MGIKDKQVNFSKMTEGEALYSIGARTAEKDGKKGIQIRELFIEGSDEKPGAIVASEHKKYRVKGTKKTRCRDCGCKVWISPSTQEMLKCYPDVPVICIACLMKREQKS